MIDKSYYGKKFCFDATLENWAEGMDYCAVTVPAKVTESLGTKGPVLVSASINNSAMFQVSLFPVGGGKHCIRIKSSIRKLTDTKEGDVIKINFTVLNPDDVDVPDDLLSNLEAEGMIDGFMDLPSGKRNYLIRRIREAAKQVTRDKRIREVLDAIVERELKNSNKR